ncbi:uncharacterized protein LOC106460071 isoform X4 [Limulus polyphemus]|uniref:Uncharacterized protein LOC106460071 isoform X4 n=1 Tax=Limulus polyphemus TaxID=6850 RepID=A0ABM1SFJ8_LIMPO|nr:uncharacterized protein LOC106460071 isoform X4 [Limulus polyphemus]
MGEQNIVSDWLRSLKLETYAESFLDNGYDDLEICKQIGELDLDGIGVTVSSHRQTILQAVKRLLEHGGTAVYYTVEEQLRMAGAVCCDTYDDYDSSIGPSKQKDQSNPHLIVNSPKGDGDGKTNGDTVANMSCWTESAIPRQFVDEYEEGKAELVKFPRIQLKMIVRDKLIRDGIRLSAEPYSNMDGTRGCLDSLARRYSEELKTHYRDVMDRLEELRRRRVAIDIPPLPLDLGNFKQRTTASFKPGKYSPSSCLNDQEEENIYGLYQGQTGKAVNVGQTERYLSPRSKSFYQPCPFTTAEAKSEKPYSNGTKKKGGLGKLFRSFGTKKDKCKEKKSRKSEKNDRKLQLPCKSPCSKNHVEVDVPSAPVHQFQIQIGEEERDQLMMMVHDGYMTMEQAVQKNRTSYSTSEEGQSQSSDYEETEEIEKKMDSGLSRDHSGRSSLAGRVRELHRDVRRRFSRLKSSRCMPDTEQLREPVDQQDGITRPGSSLESLPSENGSSSRCSLQTQTPSSSNRSSTSVGEDEGTPYIGPFLGRARALTDYTPSPYDRDALAFKKGDIIDIIAKHNTGIWVGMLHGRVGSFKFINVEELRKEVRHRQLRFKRSTQLASLAAMRPQTLEDILHMVGLEQYTHILVLNGYKHLDSFKDIEIEDLEGLGILEPDHQQQLLRAADMLLECEATHSLATHPEREEPIEDSSLDKEKNTGRDSGCYTGREYFTNQEPSRDVDNFHCVGCIGHSSNSENISNEVLNVRNNLDADYLPQQNAQTSSQSYNNTSTNSMGSFNIPITYSFNLSTTGNEPIFDEEKVVLRKKNDDSRSSRAQIVENEKHETQATANCSPEDVIKVSSQLSCCENGCFPVDHEENMTDSKSCTCVVCSMKSKSCIAETFPQPTSPVNTKCVLSTPQDSPVHVSCGSGFAMRVRCATLPRKKQQDSEDPPPPGKRDHKIVEKKQNRKFGFRKGTLQDTRHIIQSQGLTLLSVVTNKLEEEKIDLCQEPYTDKTGFCGIPPALVQRYSEELQRDIYDVAEVLDQARINALHQQERKGIPNDFLADSCNEPVVEANYSCLHDWLTSLGLPMYTEHFQRAGYSQLEQIVSLREADLRHCGINCSRHLRLLTSAIGTLHIHLAKYGTG